MTFVITITTEVSQQTAIASDRTLDATLERIYEEHAEEAVGVMVRRIEQ